MSRRLENLIRRYKEICPQEPCFNLTKREQDLYARLEAGEDIGDDNMEYLIEQAISEKLKEQKYAECFELREQAQEYHEDASMIEDEEKRKEVQRHLNAIDVVEGRRADCVEYNKKRFRRPLSMRRKLSTAPLESVTIEEALPEEFATITLRGTVGAGPSTPRASRREEIPSYMGIPGLTREIYTQDRRQRILRELAAKKQLETLFNKIHKNILPLYFLIEQVKASGISPSDHYKNLDRTDTFKTVFKISYADLYNPGIEILRQRASREDATVYDAMNLSDAYRIRNAIDRYDKGPHTIKEEPRRIQDLIDKLEYEKAEQLRRASQWGVNYYLALTELHIFVDITIYCLKKTKEETERLVEAVRS